MWRVNEVIKYGGRRYRILHIEANSLFWIDIDDNKGLPEQQYLDSLNEWVEDGLVEQIDDPYAYLQGEVFAVDSPEHKMREEAYAVIEDVIVDEGMFYMRSRSERLKNAIAKSGKGKSTVYKYLRRYWQRGQQKNAMLPDYKNSGAPGKQRNFNAKKAGRSRMFGRGEGVPINEAIRKQFRRTIDEILMKDKGFSIRYAYRQFSAAYKFKHPEVGEHEIPTLRQFQYFYHSEYTKPEQIAARTPAGNYAKDVRPLHGTATEQALGPGSRYEIDATIADIYLVDDEDSEKIIGRPTVYMVIDVFSRMVTGFYIGFDNPSYPVAMKALISSFGDKVEVCKKFGVEINTVQWPCIGLPDVVLADRGELMSHQVSYLIDGLGVRLESAPPRRGDAKGIVERAFSAFQAVFKPYLPGMVEGSRVKKHGEKDYRVDAVISKRDFTEIILHAILMHNLRKPLEKYDRAADIPTDVPSIPIELWNWGLQHRAGRLRMVDMSLAQVLLLPRQKVTISEQGVKMWGLAYTGREIIEAGWMHRSSEINRPKGLYAAYDLGSANHIYLFPEPKKNKYWVCDLSSRSREFQNMTWNQVWQRQKEQKQRLAEAKYECSPEERALDELIKQKVKKATKTAAIRSSSSDAKRIRAIKPNKAEAREKERREMAVKPQRPRQEQPAKVIPFKEEEDYKFPSFIPELFDEGDES